MLLVSVRRELRSSLQESYSPQLHYQTKRLESPGVPSFLLYNFKRLDNTLKCLLWLSGNSYKKEKVSKVFSKVLDQNICMNFTEPDVLLQQPSDTRTATL